MITVAQALPSDRALFIRRTDTHLAGAVAALITVEYLLLMTGIAAAITNLLANSRFIWLAILGGFAILGWLTRSLIARAKSGEQQCVGLGLYGVGEALIFAPILYVAAFYVGGDVIPIAATFNAPAVWGIDRDRLHHQTRLFIFARLSHRGRLCRPGIDSLQRDFGVYARPAVLRGNGDFRLGCHSG
jgi:hypothetical protein